MESRERRHDIDWIRVIAFYILILFHVGMVFVPWDFHIKNNTTAEWFETWMAFLSQWRLPLLFLVSGAGVYFAFGKRNWKQFAAERTRRLFIPLLLGIFVIVPPQIFIERISNGAVFNNYIEFWGTVFNFIPYPAGGSFSWHHLWFVAYIFVFSLILIPFFVFLRGEGSLKFREKIAEMIDMHPNLIYTFSIPLLAVYYFMAPLFPTTHALYGDWYNLLFSLLFFITGFLICSVKGVWEIIEKKRRLSLRISILPFLFLTLFVWGPTFEIVEEDTYTFFFFYSVLRTILIVSLIYAILGYGKHYLNKPGKFLSYANESVYPLYILHQTVLIVLGFYIIKMDLSIVPKFLLLTAGTFTVSYALYELFIRRFNFMRFLFGMKSRQKEK